VIFAPESISAINAGRKTQTRRPVKDEDFAVFDAGMVGRGLDEPLISGDRKQCEVRDGRGRRKWVRGRTYSMNPPPPPGVRARMGKQVGRILLKGIRCERVRDISDEDAEAEGVIHTSWKRGGPWTSEEEAWFMYGALLVDDPEKQPWAIRFKGKVYYGETPREAFLLGWKSF